jgi:hypothetical protein
MSSNMLQQIAALLAANKDATTDAPSTRALEQQANVDSLDVNTVRNVDAESTRPKLTTRPKVEETAETIPASDQPITVATARSRSTEADASLFLTKFMRISLTRAPIYEVSTYIPSSRLMFYILHCCNNEAVDNFYLNRAIPGFHPLFMRYYFSVLYFIQTLRAMHICGLGDINQRDFRREFLELFPPETLSIPGPLLNYFKTLCCSQPQETYYGKVCPTLPNPGSLGAQNGFQTSLLPNLTYANLVPQIPLILAMMSDMLGTPTGAANKGYGYSPVDKTDVTSTTATFGGRTFDCTDKAAWIDNDAWAFIASGIEHPIELDGSQNQSAQSRFSRLGFPLPNFTRSNAQLRNFLNLNTLRNFAPFVKMAALYCRFFVGSGTLADCSPDGLQSNQIYSVSNCPTNDDDTPSISKPTGFYDLDISHYHSMTHYTSRNELPSLTETLAFAAQSNTSIIDHPVWPDHHRNGPFWQHQPTIGESELDNSYIGIPDIVSTMHIRGNIMKP